MTQTSYFNSNKSIEKDETDRIIPRAFHNKTPQEKEAELIAAYKKTVNERYSALSESDVNSLAEISDRIRQQPIYFNKPEIEFLVNLATKVILENEQLKSDLFGFVKPIMEKHIALDQITKTLQRPNPIASAMGRLE